MRRIDIVSALLIAACLIGSGCRTTRPELQTWGERDDDGRDAPPPAAAAPKLVTAQEAALAAESARACANQAAALAQKDVKHGWTLLSACAGREDFTLLEVLVSEPWLGEVKGPAGPSAAARVIANRGGDVYGDIKVLQDRQVPIWTLEQALETTKAKAGSTLLVRGELAEVAPADAGVTLKIVETSWHTAVASTDDDDTVMASDDTGVDKIDGDAAGGTSPTGRTLFVSAGKLDPSIKVGQEWLLVVSFVAAEKCKGSTSKIPMCGKAKLVTIGKPAAKLRDNW